MTKKLYDTNPDMFEWHTEITGMEHENGKWIVTLKETAFYPEGGGQPCDTGTIGSIPVEYVYKNKDEEVYHVMPKKPEQTDVFCKIDSERRIIHSQHHSGQHLLSATCYDLFQYETLSFHLSDETATIDLNVQSLTEEEMATIETEVNRRIVANYPVKTFYIDLAEADKYSLRKIPEGHDRLRIVEIQGIEYNACGGTHVRSTAEIGLLKLLKQEKTRGNTRLYFICGLRLLEDYEKQLAITDEIARMMTTAVIQLPEQIDKILTENKTYKKNYATLIDQYAEIIKSNLLEHSQGTIIEQVFDDFTIKELEIIAAKIRQETNKVILFGSRKEQKILLSHNGKLPVHCGQILKTYLEKFNGKGGGNNEKAQAVFQNISDLEKCFQSMKEYLQHIIPVNESIN